MVPGRNRTPSHILVWSLAVAGAPLECIAAMWTTMRERDTHTHRERDREKETSGSAVKFNDCGLGGWWFNPHTGKLSPGRTLTQGLKIIGEKRLDDPWKLVN